MIKQDVKAILESPNYAELELLAIFILSDARNYNGDDKEVLEGYKEIRNNKSMIEEVFPGCVGIL